MSPRHVPVLLAETLGYLEPRRGGLFVDCTVGLGGHADALLETSPEARLLGIDRDPHALDLARERLSRFGTRVTLTRGRFGDLPRILAAHGDGRAAGLLADLGLSSLQLGDAERGFAFGHDGPLDMRMDAEEEPEMATAAEIVNRESEDTLIEIFRTYGEERQARRIARAIVRARREKPFTTTGELAELVARVKGRPARRTGKSRAGRKGPGGGRRRSIHPATQVFQSLRIEVNHELHELEALMALATDQLEQDGRMVMISYHSLEDRIVKNALRDLAAGKRDPITGRPRAETRVIEVLTKKPIRPSPAEVAANPRARSARLRAGRRI